MSIILNDNIKIFAPKSIDDRVLFEGTRPYSSVEEATTTVNQSDRFIGLEAIIKIEDDLIVYWYKDGIQDEDLIPSTIKQTYENKDDLEDTDSAFGVDGDGKLIKTIWSKIKTFLGNVFEPKNDNIQEHISDEENPHGVTSKQTGSDVEGTAAGIMEDHTTSYDHNDITHDNRTELNKVSGTNTGDQDLSPYIKESSQLSNLETSAKTIAGAVNEVRTISLGATSAFVFDTEAIMSAWLLVPENVAKLKTGNNLLIRELNVPDYWWDGATALELEVKIDLSAYYNKSEVDQLLTGKQANLTFSTNIETDKASTTKISAIKTLYDWAVGKFIDSAISKTYAELFAMKSASELVVGQLYLISDYRTKYTQPVSNEILTCSVEPIIVQAITTSSFSTVAHSTLFPQDILYYSFDNNALNAPGADMGYIMRRNDTLREVDVPFDFRNVKFRRWGITATAWEVGTTYAKNATVLKNNKLYISVDDGNVGNDPELTSTEKTTLLTYEWIYVDIPVGSKVAHDSLGTCGNIVFTPTGEYEDYLMFSSDEIYETTRNFKMYLRGWHLDTGGTAVDHNIWIPVNTVFFRYNTDTYYGIDNVVIYGDFFNNTFCNGMGMCQAYQIFYDNFFVCSCSNNFFNCHTRYNFFAGTFQHNNSFTWDLSDCVFNKVKSTTISNGNFSYNNFAYDLTDSYFSGTHYYDVFKHKCENNEFRLRSYASKFKGSVRLTISDSNMYKSVFNGTSLFNIINGVFQNNIFNGDTSYNNFDARTSDIITNGLFKENTSKFFRDNTISGDIQQCNFESDVRYMTFPSMTNVTVGKGVYSKDLSSVVFEADKIYRIDKLPSGSLKLSYTDNFGIENSTII